MKSRHFFRFFIMKLYRIIPTRLKAPTVIYRRKAPIYRPSPIRCPPNVDETTDGMRATSDIKRKFTSLISVSPTKYVNRSFGVPGRKNSKKTSISRRLSVLRKDSSFIFSREIKTSTDRTPNLRVRMNIKADASKTPI